METNWIAYHDAVRLAEVIIVRINKRIGVVRDDGLNIGAGSLWRPRIFLICWSGLKMMGSGMAMPRTPYWARHHELSRTGPKAEEKACEGKIEKVKIGKGKFGKESMMEDCHVYLINGGLTHRPAWCNPYCSSRVCRSTSQ